MDENKEMVLPEKLQSNDMAHELVELPKAINEFHLQILNEEKEIGELQMLIEIEENKMKREIVNDVSLSNKEKRDIALAEKIKDNADLIELKISVRKLIYQKDLNDIQLKYLYNRFTSLKYLIRLLESLNG
jgi:hypothetical protein